MMFVIIKGFKTVSQYLYTFFGGVGGTDEYLSWFLEVILYIFGAGGDGVGVGGR